MISTVSHIWISLCYGKGIPPAAIIIKLLAVNEMNDRAPV